MLLLIALYLVLPALQTWFFLDPATSHLTNFFVPGADELTNYVLAVLCFHWMMANIIITARIPFLQKHIPHDARIRFHIIATIAIALSFAYHTVFKILVGKEIDPVSWILLGVFAVMMVLSVVWIRLPGFVRFRSFLGKILRKSWDASYALLKRTHNVVMLTLAGFMLLHLVIANVLPPEAGALSFAIYIAYSVAGIGLFAWAKLRVLFLPKLRLISMEEINDLRVLTFESDRPIRYRAGQFAYLSFPRSGRLSEEHPFSFLSCPDDRHISFGIRAKGDFTRELSSLAVGSVARINPGFGAFAPASHDESLCFISTGVGSVPFISLIKDMHRRGDTRPVKFFISVKDEAEIPHRDDLDAILLENPQVELKILVPSRDGLRYHSEFFAEHIDAPRNWSYYVCTSPEVFKSIKRSLAALGVSGRSIRKEAFAFI